MAFELKIPAIGESVNEVEIGAWRKSPGDAVKKDEVLVVLESEKATLDLAAPEDGVLEEIFKKEGETAAVGEAVARIGAAGTEAPAPSAKEKPAKEQAESGPAKSEDSFKRVMPAAQRLLEEHGLRAEDVHPSGPGGRLLKEDVLRHVKKSEPDRAPALQPPDQQKDLTPPRPAEPHRQEEIVPMNRLRRTLAERLVAAQQNAALLTTFNEIDMGQVMELRKQFGEAFQARHNARLGLMSFFVKAAIEALKSIPQVNAEIRENNFVYRNFYDIAVAVGGGRGLVTPVLRNAERMSFAEIEVAIADFARRAKENKLTLEELRGGTFTISNGGVYGSLLSTPIVNPPQSGILGLHAIQERPVARQGEVVIRPMMYAALTYDHRIVDGREAVTFLKRIKEIVETPARMLIEI
jgi:2-oxoglutarate dehydrogenase E2 component (dihydrolipoamide succinyltransferase)